MGAGGRLIAIGRVAREVIGCAREKACDAAADEVVGAGRGQFI